MIYSSSAANYGINGDYPSNLYGWSKYAGEQYVLQNSGIALRYFNVYGPGEEHKGRMSSVAFQMYQKQKSGEKIYLFPRRPKRDFVYIKDVISANLYAAEHFDQLLGNYYEVGSGKAEAFESVLDELQIPYEYTPESSIPKGYQFFTQSQPISWMKGWKPEFDLQRGLKDYKKHLDKKV
jgi:ADP-L-glycero-D-manno-heptose 6-epimerase